MNTATRYELDAKCQAIEAKMDARVEHIENIAQELKKEFKNAKWWAIGAVVTVLASFVGVIQLTTSWQQATINIIASRVENISDKIDTLSNNLAITNQHLNKISKNKP